MRSLPGLVLLAAALGCSDSDDPGAVMLPLGGESESAAPGTATGVFATFTDESTGFATDAVHDADRQIVHFDAARGAMVFDASGEAVEGWAVSGEDLSWSGFAVEFRVRFGTEEGERRAYFTETAVGTICNLRLAGGRLGISGTSERPPNP